MKQKKASNKVNKHKKSICRQNLQCFYCALCPAPTRGTPSSDATRLAATILSHGCYATDTAIGCKKHLFNLF